MADSYVFIDINEKKAEADAQILRILWQIYLAMQTLSMIMHREDADVIISSLGNIQLQHNAGEDALLNFHLLEKRLSGFRNLKIGF